MSANVLFKVNGSNFYEIDSVSSKYDAINLAKRLHDPDWDHLQWIEVVEFKNNKKEIVFSTRKK